jgi:hypothetical protein
MSFSKGNFSAKMKSTTTIITKKPLDYSVIKQK